MAPSAVLSAAQCPYHGKNVMRLMKKIRVLMSFVQVSYSAAACELDVYELTVSAPLLGPHNLRTVVTLGLHTFLN